MIRLRYNGKQSGRKFRHGVRRAADRVGAAAAHAVLSAQREILSQGRANISGAGNFGSRWLRGLHADINVEPPDTIAVDVWHEVPYFSVFQEGKVIEGKPLLWIPLSWHENLRGVRARDYPGRLFRVNRRGGKSPLLLDYDTKDPMYSGHESVTIPKKFRIVEIVREVSVKLRDWYRERMSRRG